MFLERATPCLSAERAEGVAHDQIEGRIGNHTELSLDRLFCLPVPALLSGGCVQSRDLPCVIQHKEQPVGNQDMPVIMVRGPFPALLVSVRIDDLNSIARHEKDQVRGGGQLDEIFIFTL